MLDISKKIKENKACDSELKEIFSTIEETKEQSKFYRYFIDRISQNAKINISQQYVIKALDERWVNIVEDSLIAIDNFIRSPKKFIEEIENVVPIEMSRNISSRSIKHLSQHTDYINKIEGDMIQPSKILNVYREETMQTYENKFVNTLLNRLYIFVNRRYTIAFEKGYDQKKSIFNLSSDFIDNTGNGKVTINIEYDELPVANEEVKLHIQAQELYKRVKHINDVVTAYTKSTFAIEMGRSYIRPPVMRTNAILKNKDLKQCLQLWEFIESYENAGFELLVQEIQNTPEEDDLKKYLSLAATQYITFRENIENINNPDYKDVPQKNVAPKLMESLDIAAIDYPIYDYTQQKIVYVSSLFKDRKLTMEEFMIAKAIYEATLYEKQLVEERRKLENQEENEVVINTKPVRPKKSYYLNLLTGPTERQNNYTVIKNYLLSYGLISKITKNKEVFVQKGGKDPLKSKRKSYLQVKICTRGKSLKINLNLDPSLHSEKYYHFKDESEKSKDLKMSLIIRSQLSVKKLKQLIDFLAIQEGFIKDENYQEQTFDFTVDNLSYLEKLGYGHLVKEEITLEEVKTMDNAFAEEILIKVPYSKNIGKNSEAITIDQLSNYFENGETITRNNLYDKHLINNLNSYIKIISSETLNKKLIVQANEFTPNAVKMLFLAGGSAIKELTEEEENV